jgi:hypothetical protein
MILFVWGLLLVSILLGGAMEFNATFNKPEYPEKTTDLPQFTDKTLSHNVGSSTRSSSRIRIHNVRDDRH